MKIERISDPTDDRLEPFRDIKERTWVRDRGFFLAEGSEVLRTLIHRGRFPVVKVMVNERQAERLQADLEKLPADVPVYEVPRAAMTELVGYDLHRGVLALGSTEALDPDAAFAALDVPDDRPSRVVLLEGVNNHDNIGGIFRSVSAFGAQAVLLSDDAADPLYRRAIRVSMGASLVVPFARLGPNPFLRLKELGYTIWALTPSADALDLSDIVRSPDTLPKRLALAVGTEGPGLTQTWMQAADDRICIRMAPGHDSLNAATAATVALFAVQPR